MFGDSYFGSILGAQGRDFVVKSCYADTMVRRVSEIYLKTQAEQESLQQHIEKELWEIAVLLLLTVYVVLEQEMECV